MRKIFRDGNSDFDFGLGLCGGVCAPFLNVERVRTGAVLPAMSLCPYPVSPSRSSKYLSLDNLADGLEFCGRMALTLCGDVVTQVVCMTKPEEEYFNWHLVWFPIASPYRESPL